MFYIVVLSSDAKIDIVTLNRLLKIYLKELVHGIPIRPDALSLGSFDWPTLPGCVVYKVQRPTLPL